jgi:succinate-semialdehyde dehydrogenase/glutarate-semialdehyde dehydrogenase
MTTWKTQSLVEGRWIGNPEADVLNPATGDVVGRVPNNGEAEARAAVDAAAGAFTPWSQMIAKQRGRVLRQWYDNIVAHREELARLLTAEQGKPLAEARGEIDYAASFVEFYAEESRRIHGETIPSHRKDSRILVWRQPIGVCAAITPWNFPAAMVTRKCAPALAAGCTVVLKPAMETPLTALALAQLFPHELAPAGTLNVITGDAAAIGKAWCQDPRVRLVSFTGSTEIGKLLIRQAADTVKKLSLELGGNAPFLVFDDADLDAAADGAIFSKFRNMGQTCICANRFYVQSGIYDRFAEALAHRVREMVVGDGAKEGVTQGPLISSKAVEKVQAHLDDAVSGGARIVCGGKPHALGGTYFQPTVLVDVEPTMRVCREETFGPVAPLICFDHEADAIALANASRSGLAAYFYTRDIGRAIRCAEQLEAGMVGVNSPYLSCEAAPFGGVKESGLGREGGREGITEFLETKYVLLGGLEAP